MTARPSKKLSARQMAILAIVDAMRADMANGADYVNQHPLTHDELSPRTAEAVERNIHRIATKRSSLGTFCDDHAPAEMAGILPYIEYPDMTAPPEVEPLDIEAVKRLCDEATPGPWVVERSAVEMDGGVRLQSRWIEIAGRFGKGAPADMNDPLAGNYPSDSTIGRQGERNAAFMAECRTLVPLLLAEVERLGRRGRSCARPIACSQTRRRRHWRATRRPSSGH